MNVNDKKVWLKLNATKCLSCIHYYDNIEYCEDLYNTNNIENNECPFYKNRNMMTNTWKLVKKEKPVVPCLGCDIFGHLFIVNSIVKIKNKVYEATDFDFDIDKFLKGKDIGNGIKVLPREIIAWLNLPAPFNEGEND